MGQNCCSIYTSKLCDTKRLNVDENIISKEDNEINITFCENETLEKFEEQLSDITGSSYLYSFKKKLSATVISVVSVVVIMFAPSKAVVFSPPRTIPNKITNKNITVIQFDASFSPRACI